MDKLLTASHCRCQQLVWGGGGRESQYTQPHNMMKYLILRPKTSEHIGFSAWKSGWLTGN